MPSAEMAAAMELDVGDGSLRLEICGDGSTVVLLHGWALDHRVWRPQMEGLANQFELIALDRRGFGRSSAPPGLPQELDDLLLVCKQLSLSQIVLVGMSQGGRVALHFARSHPELVRGLVLQGAPLDGFQPAPRGGDLIPLDDFAALVREGRLDAMKSQWRAHPLMRASQGVQPQLDAMLSDYQARDLLADAPHGLAPLAASLHEIKVPTFVVTGEQDTPWRSLVGDALAYGLPNGRRCVVAGGHHLCNLTHPLEYNALISEFVGSLDMNG
jgi:pimeloyl-[acyl-carrier protein] methyl ester esterase